VQRRSRCEAGLIALALTALALSGCSKGKHAGGAGDVGGHGKALAPGVAADLRITQDGKFGTYLLEGEKPRIDGIPPQTLIGALHVVPLQGGGAARKVASGVTNVPGGYLFTADSRWLIFLAGFNPAAHAGELHALDLRAPDSKPLLLGPNVTYMVPSPDSKTVAFVSGNVLRAGPIEGPWREVAAEVSSLQFSPDSKWLFFKRTVAAAGGLYLAEVAKAEAPRKLADQVGEVMVSPDSQQLAFAVRSETVRSTYELMLAAVPDFKPTKLAVGVSGFAFSPDSKWLGRVEGGKPEELGALHVGPASGGPGRKVGEKVGEFSFAPDSTAVAYMESWDNVARAGLVGVAQLPDGKPKRIGSRAPNYEWGRDGKFIAFNSRFLKPIYSVDLMLYQVGGEEDAFKVHPGVFAFAFGPENEYLVFRSNCIRNGRACDLFKVDLRKPKDPPLKIVDGVFSFRPAEKGDRMLVTYARTEGEMYDVAVYNMKSGERRTLEQYIHLPAYFLDSEGSKVAYLVARRDRAGVYVAEHSP
jgi:hypothetical protein